MTIVVFSKAQISRVRRPVEALKDHRPVPVCANFAYFKFYVVIDSIFCSFVGITYPSLATSVIFMFRVNIHFNFCSFLINYRTYYYEIL